MTPAPRRKAVTRESSGRSDFMEIKDKDFKKEVLESERPVLVDFWGSWCIPCKRMEEIMEKLCGEYDKKVKFVSLNVNRNPVTSQKYDVLGVPCFMLFHKGQILAREVGAKSENQLRIFLEKCTGGVLN